MTRPQALTITLHEKARVSGLLQVPQKARACYVLAHGAGAGMSHPFMAAIAEELAERGIATLRYQFPYMEQGGRQPDPPNLAQATVRAEVALAMATGLIPCPLTTFIVTFAIARGMLAVGLVAVGAMLAGIVTTLVTFAVTAVIARDRLLPLLARTERLRWRIGKALEATSAVAVVALGLLLLTGQIGKIGTLIRSGVQNFPR